MKGYQTKHKVIQQMHELSMANEIIEIVNQYVADDKKHLVKNIKVKVGRFSNILPDSLSFCFDAIIQSTSYTNVKLKIEEVALEIICDQCKSKNNIEPYSFTCPACGSAQIKLVSGSELTVEEIELEEEE